MTTLTITHLPPSREAPGDRLREYARHMADDLHARWEVRHREHGPTITLHAEEGAVREVAALYLDGVGVGWEIAAEVAA